MTDRRKAQGRTGQKHTASPGDLRTKAKPRPVHVRLPLEDLGYLWPRVEDLMAAYPEHEWRRVSLEFDGRRLDLASAAATFRFLFGPT